MSCVHLEGGAGKRPRGGSPASVVRVSLKRGSRPGEWKSPRRACRPRPRSTRIRSRGRGPPFSWKTSDPSSQTSAAVRPLRVRTCGPAVSTQQRPSKRAVRRPAGAFGSKSSASELTSWARRSRASGPARPGGPSMVRRRPVRRACPTPAPRPTHARSMSTIEAVTAARLGSNLGVMGLSMRRGALCARRGRNGSVQLFSLPERRSSCPNRNGCRVRRAVNPPRWRRGCAPIAAPTSSSTST